MPIDGPVITPPAIYQEVVERCRPPAAKPVLEHAVIRPVDRMLVAKERCPVAIEEQIMPGPQVARLCMEWSVTYKFPPPPPGEVFLGCMLRWPDRCKVVRIDREDVRIHETAHCAGWAADHPTR
jgi:hypothetical protein